MRCTVNHDFTLLIIAHDWIREATNVESRTGVTRSKKRRSDTKTWHPCCSTCRDNLKGSFFARARCNLLIAFVITTPRGTSKRLARRLEAALICLHRRRALISRAWPGTTRATTTKNQDTNEGKKTLIHECTRKLAFAKHRKACSRINAYP